MNLKNLSLSLSLLLIAFVALGDRFLPSPMNTYSAQMRMTANHALAGLLPQIKSQNNDAKMENAVDDLSNRK